MRSRRARPRKKRRTSCLSCSVMLGVALLLLIEGYILWVRPQVSEYIGQQVSTQLGLSGGALDPATSGQVQERIQQGQQMLPTAIAALPAGEIRLTDADANAFFAANSASLAPLESLRVQFVPGQVQADVGIYGTRVRVISDIAVQDGRLRVVNPRIDGPLSYVLSMEDLIRPIEQQFNDQLIGQGQIVREARIEQGQLVVVVGQS